MKINYIYIMAALVCACFSSCSSSEDTADDAATAPQTLVPLSTISLGGAATVSSAGAKAATRGGAGYDSLYYFFQVETSFEGHDGSSSGKPLSVGYYYDATGIDAITFYKAFLQWTPPASISIQPVSRQILSDAGFSTSGITSDGTLLVPTSGEFRMRIHGIPSVSNIPSKELMTTLTPNLEYGNSTQFGLFWNGTVKMDGNKLTVTKDDMAADKSADNAESISLYYPYAFISLKMIGAYGEATTENPYLTDGLFNITSTVLYVPADTWTAPSATSGTGTADLLTSPWLLGQSAKTIESDNGFCFVPDGSHADATAADGSRNVLFTLTGRENSATYHGHIYKLYVPAGGVTYKAGYKYTYHVRLTESTATIESVTISNYTDDGSYTIDMDGNVSDDNSK